MYSMYCDLEESLDTSRDVFLESLCLTSKAREDVRPRPRVP